MTYDTWKATEIDQIEDRPDVDADAEDARLRAADEAETAFCNAWLTARRKRWEAITSADVQAMSDAWARHCHPARKTA